MMPDKSAAALRQELIEETQPLVFSLATGILRGIPVRVELDDLIAYGEVGLAQAARDFDPDRGVQFTTFAFYRIRGAIYDGLSKMSWISRARYKRLSSEAKAAREVPTAATPYANTAQDHDDWLAETTEKVAVVHLMGKSDRAEGVSQGTIEDTRAQAPHIVARRELGEKLHELVEELPPAERRLIQTVYFEGHTLQEAANLQGISKSWASRLHARSLGQLARRLTQLGAND